MSLRLGYHGKLNAVTTNISGSLYVGLLTALPANADGASYATVIANEFSISANFYSGRKPIVFTAPVVDHNGAVAYSNSTLQEWDNTSGSDIFIFGFFITDSAASGTPGQVLWIGEPDEGSVMIRNGKKASFSGGTITVGVD
jgi:hypothetical protein